MPRYGHITDVLLKSIETYTSATQSYLWYLVTSYNKMQINLNFAAAGNLLVRAPSAGQAVKIRAICIELSAAVDLGFRWTTTGTIYYMRTTAGPFVMNFTGAYIRGAIDESLYFYASGACTVKGFIVWEETTEL